MGLAQAQAEVEVLQFGQALQFGRAPCSGQALQFGRALCSGRALHFERP
jgi:hypothetical protein